MFYGDFVFKFFSLDSILFALFDILTLFQGRLNIVLRFFHAIYLLELKARSGKAGFARSSFVEFINLKYKLLVRILSKIYPRFNYF
ncbi:hypothetical protein [Leptospira kirschneri]|uniref:hypothetical protein n=1 Tax=Leptospira kirschneri TaxID=29507 RepID=UPI003EBD7D1D